MDHIVLTLSDGYTFISKICLQQLHSLLLGTPASAQPPYLRVSHCRHLKEIGIASTPAAIALVIPDGHLTQRG